jgi:Domain of unknown function (DUF927)
VHRLAAGTFKHIGPNGEQFYLDHLDPEYRAEGESKLGGWKTGPPLCVSFELEYPGGCEGCPFFDGRKRGLERFRFKAAIHAGRVIGTPARAFEPPRESDPSRGGAREESQSESAGIPQSLAQAFAEADQAQRTYQNGHKFNGEATHKDLSSIILPEGFYWHNGRLAVPFEDKDGHETPLVISHNPIYLEGIYRSEMGTAFGRTYAFRQWLPHEGWVPISIPAGDVHSVAGLGAVTNGGANILDPGQFRRFVQASVDKMNIERAQELRYEQCGWKDGYKLFLTGSTMIDAKRTYPVIVNDELNTRAPLLGPLQGGNIQEWRRAVQELLPPYDHSGWFVLLVSLGAIFMSWLHPHESGGVLNLRDISSGTGKTLRLQIASSAWGRWHGLRITNRDTDASQGYKRAVLCHLPVFHDELVDQAVNKDPAYLVNMLGNRTEGTDKDRMQSGGKGLQYQAGRHQNIELTASNNSVWDHCRAYGRGSDAAIMRCLEITSRSAPHLTVDQVTELQRIMWDNSGWAGQMFVQWVINNLDFCRNMVSYWNNYLAQHTNLDQRHRFWLRTIVCGAVAGAVSEEMGGLLPIPDYKKTIDWVLNDIDALSGKRRVDEEVSGGDGDAAMGDFIAANRRNCMNVHGPFMPGTPPTAPITMPDKLVMRYEENNRRLMFARDTFRKFCASNGYSYVDCVRRLKESKFMLTDSRQMSLGAGTTLPSSRQRCIEMDMAHPQSYMMPRLVAEEEKDDRGQEHEQTLGPV